MATAATMSISDLHSEVWADVKPVPQDDGPSPVCSILYDPAYSQAMDLLRALLPTDELSARALALTQQIVKLCPPNYTAWHYRARILIDGPTSELGPKEDRLRAELEWLDELAKQNMKSYQVWQHRKLIVTAYNDPSLELDFIARVLAKDSKNYHTWAYRQWVLCHFGGVPDGVAAYPQIWAGELDYIDELLRQDCRNNSAWSHRFFCIFSSGRAKAGLWPTVGQSEGQCVTSEVAYAKMQIALVPNNASAWNYLRGVSRIDPSSAIHQSQNIAPDAVNLYTCAVPLALTLLPSSREAREDPQIDSKGKSPAMALEWLLDDAEQRCMAGIEREEAFRQGQEYIDRLRVADPMRSQFWNYRLSNLKRVAK